MDTEDEMNTQDGEQKTKKGSLQKFETLRVLKDWTSKQKDVKEDNEKYLWDQLEEQCELLREEMRKDKQITEWKNIDLSDVDAVFNGVKETTRQHGFGDYYLRLLQNVSVIPGDPDVGESMWKAITFISQRATTTGSGVKPLTYDELKTLLEEKEREDALGQKSYIAELRQKLEDLRKEVHYCRVNHDKKGKQVSEAIAKRMVAMESSKLKQEYTRDLNIVLEENAKLKGVPFVPINLNSSEDPLSPTSSTLSDVPSDMDSPPPPLDDAPPPPGPPDPTEAPKNKLPAKKM